MKKIYDFSRSPSMRNYTVADLQALKQSNKKLSMSNAKDATELKACVDAEIDLLVVWDSQIEECREIAPYHFMGVGSTWSQFGNRDDILDHAFEMMRKGGDMYYTLRSYEVMEMLSKEGIPVQSHIGLIPTFSHWCGGLRGFGRTADEAMQIYQTLKRMEDVGVFAVEAECIAEEVLEAVNKKTSIVYSVYSSNDLRKQNIEQLIKDKNFKYNIRKMEKIDSFELKALNLRSYYHKNILAFGDLLHKVHPLAGQGFNMTIRDIENLLEVIKKKLDVGLSLDSSVNLDFQTKMKHKNFIFSNGIDFIQELFNIERKMKTSFISKTVKTFGNYQPINKMFSKIADKGILF